MAESEWAKGMAQEVKGGRAQKAQEDAMFLEDKQEGIAFELWTDARNFQRLAICIY
jgi:hypothetical protein